MRIALLLVLLLTALPATEIYADATISDEQIHYPVELYLEEDYYRAISEILKLEFIIPENEKVRLLRPYLLKSYYHLEDFRQVIRFSTITLRDKTEYSERVTKEAASLATLALLKLGKEEKAKLLWEQEVYGKPDSAFPLQTQIPDLIDPDRARLYSAILPGSGLLLSEEYGKATVSFLLNALFIMGCYHYAEMKQWGITGLLFFFEINWYTGGMNASAESAINYNNRLIRRYQSSWIDQHIGPIN